MTETFVPARSNPEAPLRPVRLRTSRASMERRPDGAIIVRPDEPLGPYPRVLTERLIHWASVAPDRALAAKRRENGEWRYLTYAEALQKVRAIGQAFLDRGLSAALHSRCGGGSRRRHPPPPARGENQPPARHLSRQRLDHLGLADA